MAILRTRTFQVEAIGGTFDKVFLNEDRPAHRPLNHTVAKEGYFLESTGMRMEPVPPDQFRAIGGQIYTIIK